MLFNKAAISYEFMVFFADNRREKSLGLLTQNLVKLFICTNVSMILDLKNAPRVCLGATPTDALEKSLLLVWAQVDM